MKNRILTIAILLLSNSIAFAQTEPAPAPASPEMKEKLKKDDNYNGPVFQRPLTLSLDLGTPGIGIEGKLGIHKKWNIRLGTSILPFSYSKNILFNSFESESKLKASLNKVQVLAEFKPFGHGFRIVGGVAYFYSGKLEITQKGDGTVEIGNTVITGDDVGELKFTSDWKGIAPYLGIGLFRDMPRRKFNVNLDLGTYYLSRPKAELTGTKLLADNSENNEQINKNLEGDRWLPVLQLNFNYRLH